MPTPSAVIRTIRARQTWCCGLLRSATTPSSRSRSPGRSRTSTPSLMRPDLQVRGSMGTINVDQTSSALGWSTRPPAAAVRPTPPARVNEPPRAEQGIAEALRAHPRGRAPPPTANTKPPPPGPAPRPPRPFNSEARTAGAARPGRKGAVARRPRAAPGPLLAKPASTLPGSAGRPSLVPASASDGAFVAGAVRRRFPTNRLVAAATGERSVAREERPFRPWLIPRPRIPDGGTGGCTSGGAACHQTGLPESQRAPGPT